MVKNKIGSKNTIVSGFFLMTSSTFGLGLIGLYNDPIYFKYTAIALRFFQGTGDTFLQITCYSVITNIFSD
jgi:MFS family permease